ncbi:hypothetical protein [Bacillus sp. Marseille-P3661]|uniref:hypothetical protein n=1 Tax=Bacillus sp. Marseille-P3661 TaxID=1936234 RepID=UPI000C838BD2|nr:hypothetical protein [Bacillus sp. Marseille-P3661]
MINKKLIIVVTTLSILLHGCGINTKTETAVEEAVTPLPVNEVQSLSIQSKTLAKEKKSVVLDIVVPQVQGLSNINKQEEINNYFIELGTAVEKETRKAEEELKDLNHEGSALHAEGIVEYDVKLQNENI